MTITLNKEELQKIIQDYIDNNLSVKVKHFYGVPELPDCIEVEVEVFKKLNPSELFKESIEKIRGKGFNDNIIFYGHENEN